MFVLLNFILNEDSTNRPIVSIIANEEHFEDIDDKIIHAISSNREINLINTNASEEETKNELIATFQRYFAFKKRDLSKNVSLCDQSYYSM